MPIARNWQIDYKLTRRKLKIALSFFPFRIYLDFEFWNWDFVFQLNTPREMREPNKLLPREKYNLTSFSRRRQCKCYGKSVDLRPIADETHQIIIRDYRLYIYIQSIIGLYIYSIRCIVFGSEVGCFNRVCTKPDLRDNEVSQCEFFNEHRNYVHGISAEEKSSFRHRLRLHALYILRPK